MGFFKSMAMLHRGLRYKLMLAFSLMTIIPLLASMYIVSIYVFPKLDSLAEVSLVILAAVIVALLGLLFIRRLIDPVIDMAIEAKMIASGEYDRAIPVSSGDEIGNLGESINAMTRKIKTNLDELRSYGQKMKEVNIEIHKKVLALSSLLQIGDIISAGSIHLDSLLELAVEKAALVFDRGFSVLYMPKKDGGDFVSKAVYNVDEEAIGELIIKNGGEGILEKVLADGSVMIVDRGVKLSKDMESFMSSCRLKNVLAVPVSSGKKPLALLLAGNKLDDFRFKSDDVDLIKVFAKQITIAIERDILDQRTKELAIIDDLTGLYNKNFILPRLEEEIKRAIFYQRPCSLIVINIDNFKKFRESRGELAAEEALRRMAKLFKENMTPAGKTARIGGDEFALLLPEKNKKEAIDIAEELRRKIESTNLSREGMINLSVSCGVSENPIDGATSDELFKKAMDAVRRAKLSGKNRVVA
ncbi:MAG: diguanylate cyclase [Candidatus Omnitrophota bacterium]|nr:diguanylate cyclase [Candidatus Omnitrophota bacterium]